METDEINKISDEIIENTIEFIKAEFILNFKAKKMPTLTMTAISQIIFAKMLINSVLNTCDILSACPLDIYDSLEIRDKLKTIMENKDEP